MTLSLEDALLSGVPIGVGQTAHCDVCGDVVRPNDRVEVIVLFDGSSVDLVTTRCERCARGRLSEGTQRPCWVVRATVAASIDAAGHSQVILSGASVIDRTG